MYGNEEHEGLSDHVSDDDSDCNDMISAKLKRMRERIDWNVEEQRHDLLQQLCSLTIDWWTGSFPNLLDVFRREEIDWLLMTNVQNIAEPLGVSKFVKFVARSGYKDEPDLDEDSGKPLTRRTTALHRASRRDFWTCRMIIELFEIYDRFDVNYTDEFGLTHFHVACEYGLYDVVQKFLELGRVDPNCLEYVTGDSPLHLAVAGGFFDEEKQIYRLLLKSGADPNLANFNGMTPVHRLCRADHYSHEELKLFFESCDDVGRTVRVDARDKMGRTPLQLAVTSLMPVTVDVLLDRGADLAKFTFPAMCHFPEESQKECQCSINFKVQQASGLLACVESLERRGYRLDRDDAATIMAFFAKYGLFETTSNRDKYDWRDDAKFAEEAKKKMLTPDLSLHDLIPLRSAEAAKRLAYMDYVQFAEEELVWSLPKGFYEACATHLCEKLSRGFFQRWALDALLELTCQRLPILCCDMVIEQLMIKDLWRICLAANSR
ncbi:hypothetical protein TKK_0013092 [Trichogramma kaykai]